MGRTMATNESQEGQIQSKKKLLDATNEKLLKDEKIHEEKILKLRAKLSKARKAIKLQIATT